MVFDKIKESIKKFSNKSLVSKADVEALVKEIQRDLLRADVEVAVVFELSKRIKEQSLKSKKPEGLTLKEHVLKVVYNELVLILGEEPHIELSEKTILLCGLYGSGKTTTAGKLANYYGKRGLKVGLISCDIYRPAAKKQLESISKKVHAEFFETNEKSPKKIVQAGIKKLKKDKCKVVIIDSAGRDALDKDLLNELKEISKVANPDQSLLVIPSDIGQAAGKLAKTFKEQLEISNIILTKTDNTSKGGGAITSCFHAGAQIIFIGKGEKITDFEVYDPITFVSEMMGIPNLKGLLEKAQENFDEKKTEKILKGDFDIADFYDQLKTAKKSGMFSQMTSMFQMKLPKNIEKQMEFNEDQIDKFGYLIESMTPKEKVDPSLINSSRIRRISHGSGVPIEDVRQFLRTYRQAKNMIGKLSTKSLKRGPLKNLMKGFGI